MKKLIIWLIVLLIISCFTFWSYPYILTNFGSYLIVKDQLEPADVIVILGGDGNGERVDGAVKLFKQGLAPKILMSGGPLAWRLTYAKHMKAQAQFLGVSAKAILTEDTSRSTYENAANSLVILQKLGAKKIIIVTSSTHTRRAKWIFGHVFKKENIKVIVFPVKESCFELDKWWTKHESTQRVVWEYVSIVFYLLKRY